MIRLNPALAATLVLLGLPAAVARAVPPIAPTAVSVQVGNRTADGRDIDLISTTDQPKMFNFANCLCSTPRTMKVTIGGASTQDGTTNVYFYVGPNCTDTTQRTSSCSQVSVVKLSDFFSQSVLHDITAAQVISPQTPACSAASGGSTFWVFIDWNGDGAFDETNDTVQKLELDYDAEPPGVVTDVTIESGESALNVSWTVPSDTDINALQVLCARGALPVFKSPPAAAYQSAASVCPAGAFDGGVAAEDGGAHDDAAVGDAGGDASPAAELDATAATTADGGAVTGITAAGGLEGLDPAFVCSGALGKSSTSARIDGLENGVTYYVVVVAIDKAGNASPVPAMVPGSPQEVLDFWEDYKREGGQARGCAVERPARAGWAGAAAALLGLTLALWTRRRGGRR
jgi:hypothetical protein